METEPTFIQHVSFDDLSPTIIDDEVNYLKNTNKFVGFRNHFLHIPPQFNPLLESASSSNSGSYEHNTTTSPLRKSASHNAPFTNPYNLVPTTSYEPELRARLPPPPDRPSIRRRSIACDEPADIEDVDISYLDSQKEKEMLKLTKSNTAINSGSSRGYTQSAFANLNEVEDRINSKTGRIEPATAKHADLRRKSFAGMTDEELAKLEDQYRFMGRSSTYHMDLSKFDFGQQEPTFIGSIPNKGANLPQQKFKHPFAAIYPSRPCVDHKSISITKQHPQYEKYMESLKTEGSTLPLSKRTVQCYISGRKYTWSSLDWFVHNQIQNGDHLVIVSYLPPFEANLRKPSLSSRSSSSSSSSFFHNAKSPTRPPQEFGADEYWHASGPKSPARHENEPDPGMVIESIHQIAIEKCKAILDYYISKVQDKIVKITFELIKEESKKSSILKAAKLYQPDWHIFSTVSANLQIKFKNGYVKLPYFVIRHFSTPICIIPYEFLDPKLLKDKTPNEEPEKEKLSSDKEILQWLSSTIQKTLKNPFMEQQWKRKNQDTDSDSVSASFVSSKSSSTTSINDYFPVPPDLQKKIDLFEKIGYVRPELTRVNTNMDNGNALEAVTSRSSIRSARLQFYDDNMYKVKSMVDSVSPDNRHHKDRHHTPDHALRRSGSAKDGTSLTRSSSQHNHKLHATLSTESKPRGKHKPKEEKTTVKKLFKKLFK